MCVGAHCLYGRTGDVGSRKYVGNAGQNKIVFYNNSEVNAGVFPHNMYRTVGNCKNKNTESAILNYTTPRTELICLMK